jgi:hypothetical protein
LFSSPDPKDHVRYCHHLLSVIVHKLLHFSETTGQIGTKFWRNFHWMVTYKVYGVFCWSEEYKRNKRLKGVKRGVPIYGYKLFIVHLFFDEEHPSCCYVTITVFDINGDKRREGLKNLNFLNSHPMLTQCFYFCKVLIFMSYWWTIVWYKFSWLWSYWTTCAISAYTKMYLIMW